MGTKRKRGIAVVSLVCLMLFVTACGSGRAEESVANADVGKVREEAEAEMKARHQERTQESRNAADSDEDDEAERNAEETADKEEESREPEEADDEPEAAEDGYVRGKMADTFYESEWIGFRYDLPEGFTMSGEDEMDAILEAGGSLLYDDNVDGLVDYAKLIMVYEMMAKDRYGNVLTLFVEKSKYDIDTYVEGIRWQMQNIDEIDVTMGDGETVEVGGVEFEKYSLTLDYGGVIVNEDYFLKKKGDRMICLLIGYSDNETAEKMMSGFSPY